MVGGLCGVLGVGSGPGSLRKHTQTNPDGSAQEPHTSHCLARTHRSSHPPPCAARRPPSASRHIAATLLPPPAPFGRHKSRQGEETHARAPHSNPADPASTDRGQAQPATDRPVCPGAARCKAPTANPPLPATPRWGVWVIAPAAAPRVGAHTPRQAGRSPAAAAENPRRRAGRHLRQPSSTPLSPAPAPAAAYLACVLEDKRTRGQREPELSRSPSLGSDHTSNALRVPVPQDRHKAVEGKPFGAGAPPDRGRVGGRRRRDGQGRPALAGRRHGALCHHV